jgi:hypothetical protein
MRVRSMYAPPRAPSRYQPSPPPPPKKRYRGKILFGFIIVVAIAAIATHVKPGNASAATSVIRSDLSNYCLDVHDSGTANGTRVDNYSCNNTQAQSWTISYDRIQHGTDMCLSVQNDSKVAGSTIIINQCSDDPGQVWLRNPNGFENPNSGLCLALPTSKGAEPVTVATCALPSTVAEKWTPSPQATQSSACTQLSKGETIACNAAREWNTWQSEPTSHEALLNTYTDGAPYEEWCADFVSYVYKESGFPFTQGEANGWDESDANNVQNMGFTMHSPSNYTPRPGDVAYFHYSGGHVEIVVSGGKHPTFVYGNSGTIDPTTGNGEMEANTKLSDGTLGNLVYYLSPN